MMTDAPAPLWTPTDNRRQHARVATFMREVAVRCGVSCPTWPELYQWSIETPEQFWAEVWRFTGIVASTPYRCVLEHGTRMPGARWFPDARLNFAENLLRCRDDRPAIVFRGENQVRRTLSFRELYDLTARIAAALRAVGIRPGDRIAAFVPNAPETIAAMLAATSCGAVWSSCSPDFGVPGVVDRFGQIEPRILLCADGYMHRGRWFDSLEKVQQVRAEIPSIEHVVVFPWDGASLHGELAPAGAVSLSEFITPHEAGEIAFAQLPFDHPLYIMFSSGTTGKPKCIVHGAGGTLIEHLKEHLLHTDLRPSDRLFYQTTCGWMMWNWLASGLAGGATLILYDGDPFLEEGHILWRMAAEEGVTIFGTNAKYLALIEKNGLKPNASHDLGQIHTILSTGSPLLPESFDFVYRDIRSEVCLSSISGGTDILGCFVLGSPLLPVYRGEIQTRSLGLKVEVFDEAGQSIIGRKGELVCTAPFPSMPVGFWSDPDSSKYHRAYFERFPGVWHHGDYVELTPRGGMVMFGRSDAILNPGGVRIGTAEIYNQIEQLPEIAEALVIGQEWESDVRVVLFVRLQPDLELTPELEERIRTTIRRNTTAFHVPKRIVAVTDIPRTRSGKIVELAVREVIHGRTVKNIEALANPEALALFRDRPELRS